MLLGETGRERREVLGVLRGLGEGVADDKAADSVRRAIVETLTCGGRSELVSELDESLLGVRPKPMSSVPQALAS